MFAPADAEAVADLPDRGPGTDRVDDRRHEVAVPGGGRLERVERRPPGGLVALGAEAPHALDLAALALRVDPLERRRRDRLVAVAVDADDDLVASFHSLLDEVGRLLDLALLEA